MTFLGLRRLGALRLRSQGPAPQSHFRHIFGHRDFIAAFAVHLNGEGEGFILTLQESTTARGFAGQTCPSMPSHNSSAKWE